MLMTSFGSISAISLKCKFSFETTRLGKRYTCWVKEPNTLKTTFDDRTITEVTGKHLAGQTNDDVGQLFIQDQFLPYLPLNLGTHFRNLEVWNTKTSAVEELTDDDLEGLPKLKVFDVSYNPIKILRNTFFEGHENIEYISFYECELKEIEKGALEHLVNIKEGHFQYNQCIDYRYVCKMAPVFYTVTLNLSLQRRLRIQNSGVDERNTRKVRSRAREDQSKVRCRTRLVCSSQRIPNFDVPDYHYHRFCFCSL